MNSTQFVGRVGGLAIALGVGAAAFAGTSVAFADSADSSGTGSSARSDSTASTSDTAAVAGPKRAAKTTGPRTPGTKASRSAAVSVDTPNIPSAAAAKPSATTPNSAALDRAQAAEATAPAPSAPTATPTVPSEVAETTPEVIAPTPAGVREAVSTTAKIAPAKNAGDPLSGVNPAAPVGGLVELALLEYSRRETSPAAATFAPSAAAVTNSLAPEEGVAQAAAATNVVLVMSPSGVPIPTDQYVPNVESIYFPGVTDAQFLFTPEGLYPISGVKSLPLDTSVDQGNEILLAAIQKEIAAGNTVSVFGYSQSAIISSQILAQLEGAGIPADSVNFVLVGNEMNPNGGFLSRFPNFDMPSLGIPFYGPTQAETNYQLANYTLEYDGFADFPRYPLNVLSVLNAGLGIVFVHGTYTTGVTAEDVANAIELPSTDPNQKYYILPTENLPLLQPLRFIPIIGNAIADLLQPALKVIVNLGYGDPNYGWSTNGYANELTSFGIFPDVNPLEVLSLFVDGIGQGIQNFIDDILPGGSVWQELGNVFTPPSIDLPSFSLEAVANAVSDFFASPQSVIDSVFDFISTAVTDVANFVSAGASSLYAMLLPTADILNAIVTVLPAYALNLMLDGVEQVFSGDIIGGATNAVLMPLAAASGLLTTALLIEVLVIAQGVLGAFGINVSV